MTSVSHLTAYDLDGDCPSYPSHFPRGKHCSAIPPSLSFQYKPPPSHSYSAVIKYSRALQFSKELQLVSR
ncbi:hypothetical protein BDV32DRAFT_120359 [Aspergillus pseudonomiae]|nr:hypothetical protein BDV32DRAFT_120359 [Aspergillus pseudonomiae]